MKGIETSVHLVIFLIGSIAFVLLLIGLVLTFTKTNFSNEFEIKGEKFDVVQELREYIYKCWVNNKGSSESSICFKIFVNSSEKITESDIVINIDESRIKKENIKVEDFDGPVFLLIKYEENKVLLESRYYK